jgi:hypothetical protein
MRSIALLVVWLYSFCSGMAAGGQQSQLVPPPPIHSRIRVYRLAGTKWRETHTLDQCQPARFTLRVRVDAPGWTSPRATLVFRHAFRDAQGTVQYRQTVYRTLTTRNPAPHRFSQFSVTLVIPRALSGLYLAVFDVRSGTELVGPDVLVRVRAAACNQK